MVQIEQKIKELPPELRHEVEDFIEFLIERRRTKIVKNCGRAGLAHCGIFVINTRHLSFRRNRWIGEGIDNERQD